MDKKFEVNQTKIKGCCQSCTKVATQDSKNDLPVESQVFLKLHKLLELLEFLEFREQFCVLIEIWLILHETITNPV